MPNQPKKPRARKTPPKIPPEERPLNDRQLAFCVWYVSGAVNFNGTEAARRAGYKGTDATLAVIASENLKKPNIRAEIDRRKARALSGADITVENVLRKLVVIGEKALEAGQYAPAARCAELQGKYLKMFTDRIEHVQDVEDMSLDELMALLVEVTEKGNVNLSKLLEGDGSHNSGRADTARDKKPH